MITDTTLDVVAAFVDGERVDAHELKSALAHAEARDYLAELLALREVVAQSGPSSSVISPRPTRRWIIGAAAAVVLSLGGGYALGLGSAQLSDSSTASDIVAPQPTRIIEVAPGASNISQGGR